MKPKFILPFALLTNFLIFSQNSIDSLKTNTNPKSTIAFEDVDITPLAPDCINKLTEDVKSKCTENYLYKFLINNINKKLFRKTKLESITSTVNFIIDTNGIVSSASGSGNFDLAYNDAAETIKKLPKLQPAIHNGSPVNVSYTMTYIANYNPYSRNYKFFNKNLIITEELPETVEYKNMIIKTFDHAQTPPLAPKCKTKWNTEKQKEYTKKFIINEIFNSGNSNLYEKIALRHFSTNIEFIINEQGKAILPTVTGDFPAVNEAYIETIKNFPNFTPATENGKPIKVYFRELLHINKPQIITINQITVDKLRTDN